MTLVHAVYWTNMRMRAPLMPIVDLAAAAACLPNSVEESVAVSDCLTSGCVDNRAAKLALCQTRDTPIIPPLCFQSARLLLLVALLLVTGIATRLSGCSRRNWQGCRTLDSSSRVRNFPVGPPLAVPHEATRRHWDVSRRVGPGRPVLDCARVVGGHSNAGTRCGGAHHDRW